MRLTAKTQNLLFMIAVALICLAIALQTCKRQRPAPTPEKEIIEKVVTDSAGLKRYRDSADAAYNSLRKENDAYKAESAQLRAKLAAARVKVIQAIQPNPEGFMTPECDSLAVAAAELSDYSKQLENQMDSIGVNYEDQVQTLAGIIARQDTSIAVLRGSIYSLNNIIEAKTAEFKKLARNNRWQKAKGKAAAGVAVVLLTKIIIGSLKK